MMHVLPKLVRPALAAVLFVPLSGSCGGSDKNHMTRVGKADPRLVKAMQDAEARRQSRNGQ